MNGEFLKGKLFFFSETGTEGGYWAFQNSNFISLSPPSFGVENNRRVRDKNDLNKNGLTSNAEVCLNEEWLPLPDPILNDPDFKLSSLYRGESNGDLNADKRLSAKYNFTIKYAVQRLNETYGERNWKIDRRLPNVILKDGSLLSIGDTPTTEPNRPYGIVQNGITRVTVEWNDGNIEHQRLSDTLLVEKWDYKGLHILKTGDKLKVVRPNDKVMVWEGTVQLKPHSLFSEHANGMWIHADQEGIPRDDWSKYFFDNYFAELDKKD